MKLRLLYYFVFLGIAFVFSTSPTVAQNQKRGAMLGGGGTNYSNREPDHNGLLTGVNSVRHHLIGIYLDGAYSQMLHTRKDLLSIPYGYAYGGGLLYEYQHFYLKCQTGIGMRVQNVDACVNDFIITNDQVTDAMGYPYTLYYDFKERRDRGQYLHLQIPMLFGAAYKYFYALAGVKMNFTLKANNQVTAICSTSATYPNFTGTFTEMDNHGLRKDVPISSECELLPMRFDILASGEVGVEFSFPKFEDVESRMYKGYIGLACRLRVAAFCDIGMVSLVPNTTYELVEIPQEYKWDFSTFKMNHVISSHIMKGVPLHNFYAGIKISLFVDYRQCETCKLMHNYQTEADMTGF